MSAERDRENLKLRSSDPIYAASRIMQLKTAVRRARSLLRAGDVIRAVKVLDTCLEESRALKEPVS